MVWMQGPDSIGANGKNLIARCRSKKGHLNKHLEANRPADIYYAPADICRRRSGMRFIDDSSNIDTRRGHWQFERLNRDARLSIKVIAGQRDWSSIKLPIVWAFCENKLE